MYIRLATDADLYSICSLADEIAAQHHAQAPHVFAASPSGQRDRAFWASSISPTKGVMLVAEASGTIAGFITAKLSDDSALSLLQQRTICRIGTLVVTQRHRRSGIGRQLMNAIEVWAAARGAGEIRLEVMAFNEAGIRFYQSLAYGEQSHIMVKGIKHGV